MVWCGVVWCGVVRCGVVWCGVVWCGVVWCGVVWCGVVWCGVVWCGVCCGAPHGGGCRDAQAELLAELEGELFDLRDQLGQAQGGDGGAMCPIHCVSPACMCEQRVRSVCACHASVRVQMRQPRRRRSQAAWPAARNSCCA
jgi:hypothetical protein